MTAPSKASFCAIIVLLSAFSGAAHSAAIKKGMSFLEARKLLIYSKWRPYNVHEGQDYEYLGTEKELLKARILEVEKRAMDKAVCVLNYRKRNKCLRLFTQGEEIKDMRVYHWNCSCSDGQP